MSDFALDLSAPIETAEDRAKRLSAEVATACQEWETRHANIVKKLADDREVFDYANTSRVNPSAFRSYRRFMARAVRRYIRRESARSELVYAGCRERMPLDFPSNQAAEVHLIQCKKEYLRKKAMEQTKPNNRTELSMGEAIEVFISSRVAATVMTFEGYDAATLIVYDYDKKIYTFDQNHIARWLTILTGSASNTNLRTFMSTLQSLGDKLAIYSPLPRWKIAVGNGVYNTLTHTLEKYTPLTVVINRIQTNYVPNPTEPRFASGVTFEKLVHDLADGNPDRVELIMQMCKAIITGYSATPAIFVAKGRGGDGKSLFMTLLSNVVGSSNTGALNFSDMEDDSKVVEVAQKRLVIGMDNNTDVVIKNTALLKSAASREVTSFFRKFLTAVALRFTGTVVQLCNSLPRFKETGSSIRRRIVMLSCEYSHYESGDEDYGLQENVKNSFWHEYILHYILSEDTNPYFSDFNDCDRAILNNSLDAEDPIGEFYAELASTDMLADSVKVLPRTLLYAAFQDWMSVNYPQANIHSSRTFSTRSNDILQVYGFEPSGDSNPTRISTLESTTKLNYNALLGHLSEGERMRDLWETKGVTRLLVRNKAPMHNGVSRKGRRHPKQCSAIEYFNLWDEIISDIEYHPVAYRDLLDECGISYEIEMTNPVQNMITPMDFDEDSAKDEDTYYDAAYRAYMRSHRIVDADGNALEVGGESAIRLGEALAASVRERRESQSATLAPPTEDLVDMGSFDPEAATETEFEEATDAELIENLSMVSVRAESSSRIAQRLMNIKSFELAQSLANHDQEAVDQIKDWVSMCREVSAKSSDTDTAVAFASLVDRLLAQVRRTAEAEGMAMLVARIVANDHETVNVKLDDLMDAMDTFEEGAR